MEYGHQPYECELEVSGKNLKIYIIGGRGVGRVTKKGLSCDVGKSAINPVPRAMMLKEIKAVLGNMAIKDLPRQIWVEIEVQNGERTALKTFTSTGSKACPAVVKVVATPTSATTTECSWTQGNAGATLSFVLNSPGYGLQGPVRMTLAKGLLTNPDVSGPAEIRLTEQSGAGWVGLSTDVTLRAA